MRPTKRYSVNKGKSVKSFRHGAARTKRMNVAGSVMRGGIRL